MRFRTMVRCDCCGELINGMNCLPAVTFVCRHCGAQVTLCPLCQRLGLDCPACEDKLRPEWELREEGKDRSRQVSIAEYVRDEGGFGGA